MTAEELLSRVFTEVTETTDYQWIPAALVVRRARSMRRRRVTVISVAAAAVVAVGGTTALWPHGAQSPAPTHLSPVGSLPDVAMGAAPRVGLLSGDVYLTPSGRRITSSVLRHPAAVAAEGDGILVASGPAARTTLFRTISFVAADGTTTRLGCGTPAFATGGDDPAYWLSDTCRARSAGRLVSGTTRLASPAGQSWFPVGRVSTGIVVESGPADLGDPRRGRMFNDSEAFGPRVVTSAGTTIAIPDLSNVQDATPAGDLALGQDSYGYGSVVDVPTGAVRWQRQNWTTARFSSSGRYVSGYQDVGPQTAPGVGDVVGAWDAATGRQVLRLVLPGMVVKSPPAWEGDSSLLVVVEDLQHQEAVLRIGLDGSVTRATRVLPRSELGRDGFQLVP